MLKRINKKLFWSFLLVLLTGILLWVGIHYVPKGQARFTLKEDILALDRSEAMALRHLGVRTSLTIVPQIGDKEETYRVNAYVYRHGELLFTKQIGVLQNLIEDNTATIQVYQTEGKGFKLEGLSGATGFSTEYFLADLNELSGFGIKINKKIKMTKGDEEKVMATFTIGTAFRNIGPDMKLKAFEPIKENPMTVVFTVKYEEKE